MVKFELKQVENYLEMAKGFVKQMEGIISQG
jgi:hypothetical protein